MEFLETWYSDSNYAFSYRFECAGVIFTMSRVKSESSWKLGFYYDKKLETMEKILKIIDFVGINYTFDYFKGRKYIRYKGIMQSIDLNDFFTFRLDFNQLAKVLKHRKKAA